MIRLLFINYLFLKGFFSNTDYRDSLSRTRHAADIQFEKRHQLLQILRLAVQLVGCRGQLLR